MHSTTQFHSRVKVPKPSLLRKDTRGRNSKIKLVNLLDNSDYAEKKRTNFTIREKSHMSIKSNLNRTFEPSSLRGSYKTKERLPELQN